MFGSKDRNLRAPSPTESRLDTVIGPDSTFTGSLSGQGTVRVDGRFRGEMIASDCLILGKSGDVEADVEVREAVVAGRVTGKIYASDRVVLQSGSHLEGDVYTNSLVIEEGVFFNGRCVMNDQAEARPRVDSVGDSHGRDRQDIEMFGQKQSTGSLS
jgi:cytoskeletal protein CcmA (bactofilin family)